MSRAVERQEIETLFIAHMNAASSTTEIFPANVSGKPTNGANWVRIKIIPGNRRKNEVGSAGAWFSNGIVLIQVFTPEGIGGGMADTIADHVEDAFRGKRTNHCKFVEISQNDIGVRDGWYQINVTVTYRGYFISS